MPFSNAETFMMKSSIALIFSTYAIAAQCFHPFQKPLGSCDPSEAYSSGGPFTTKFDEQVQTLLSHFHVSGVSIAVIDGNDTFAKAYGYSALPDDKTTVETLYYCASTTKSFTAASVLKLIESSANHSKPLTLKTKIQSLIRDEFVLTDPYATSHVTLEDALSHRTGMPRHDFSYGGPNATLESLVRSLRYLPMSAELRERWEYCNMMFCMVSYVVEKLSGMWLGDFLREHIWAPLGMHSTFFSLADAKRAQANGGPKLAVGYSWVNDTATFAPLPYVDSPILSGAGQIISNVLDYAKYLRAMITMNDTILTQKSFVELRTPRAFSNPEYQLKGRIWTGPEMYGLGWQMADYRGHEVFNHGGAMPGFGVEMMYIPTLKNGVGFAIMGNTEGGSNAVALVLMAHLIDEMLGIPEDERFDIVGVFDALLKQRDDELRPDNARKRAYPDAPPPNASLPLPLPLENLTGEYWNDGYRNLTVRLEKASSTHLKWTTAEKVLRVYVMDRMWRYTLTFEHVSNNYFLAWGRSTDAPITGAAVPAKFELGVDGKVHRLGIQYEASMKELIWFDKKASTDG